MSHPADLTPHPANCRLSLLKPTGHLTLGNLLGALRLMVAGQDEADPLLRHQADPHALTVQHDPVGLRELVREQATLLLAAGLADSTLFVQSRVPAHSCWPTCWSARPTPGAEPDDPVQGKGAGPADQQGLALHVPGADGRGHPASTGPVRCRSATTSDSTWS